MNESKTPWGSPVFVTKAPEGDYSTIRLQDGTIETVLFSANGGTLAERRTDQGIHDVRRQHIASIQAELNEGERS